ncbi:MAG: FtsX-like permease family protein [Microscillaceae bacterium]|nr:FtsX-like permease family protein [Microscillaceae bacterium]MDW8459743.1 FtsX-like permease family protein [Cytophagales bacterium]
MFNLLAYSLLSLRRRWKKNVVFILIYACVVGFYASFIFFLASLRYETQFVLKDIPDIWVQKITGGRLEPVPLALIDSLKNIRGVRTVQPRFWGYLFDSPTGAVFTILGADSLPQGLKLLKTSKKNILNSTQTLVGTGLLELRGLQISDELTLTDSQGNIQYLEIIGSFAHEVDLLTKDLIIVHPKTAQKILGLEESKATDLALYVYNSDEVNNIARKINQKFAGIRVVTANQLQTTYQALFSWRGSIFLYGSFLFLMAFLILIWDKATGLSALERKELGILKAIGWQITDVLKVKFYESLLVTILATSIGIWIGYLHIFVFQAIGIRSLLIGWSVLYPHYNLVPIIYGTDLLLIFIISVIPYLSVTLIPAWRAAITNPAEVMNE